MHRSEKLYMGSQMKTGRILKGRYQLDRLLKSGGMSEVFSAKDLMTGESVVVKKTRAEEIALLSRLVHPGIVRYLDHLSVRKTNSPSDWTEHYLVEEYLPGEDLFTYVMKYGIPKAALTLSVGRQLCSILEYLQAQKPPVIYRDLKPENIILQRNGKLKLVDFGIAREYVPWEDCDTVNFGTVGYAAPEQYEGSMAQSDVRSDIYGFGKVLYFLLTGDDPKKRVKEGRELFCDRVFSAVLNEGLAGIVLKSTEENPDRRYQSIGELAYALRLASQAELPPKTEQRTRGRRSEDAASGEEERREIKKIGKDGEKEADRKPEKASADPVAALLTILALLIFASGLLIGFAKGYGSFAAGEEGFGNFRWFAAVLYWIGAFAAGTLVLGFARILRLLSAIVRGRNSRKNEM